MPWASPPALGLLVLSWLMPAETWPVVWVFYPAGGSPGCTGQQLMIGFVCAQPWAACLSSAMWRFSNAVRRDRHRMPAPCPRGVESWDLTQPPGEMRRRALSRGLILPLLRSAQDQSLNLAALHWASPRPAVRAVTPASPPCSACPREPVSPGLRSMGLPSPSPVES